MRIYFDSLYIFYHKDGARISECQRSGKSQRMKRTKRKMRKKKSKKKHPHKVVLSYSLRFPRTQVFLTHQFCCFHRSKCFLLLLFLPPHLQPLATHQHGVHETDLSTTPRSTQSSSSAPQLGLALCACHGDLRRHASSLLTCIHLLPPSYHLFYPPSPSCLSLYLSCTLRSLSIIFDLLASMLGMGPSTPSTPSPRCCPQFLRRRASVSFLVHWGGGEEEEEEGEEKEGSE